MQKVSEEEFRALAQEIGRVKLDDYKKQLHAMLFVIQRDSIIWAPLGGDADPTITRLAYEGLKSVVSFQVKADLMVARMKGFKA